MFSLPCTLSRLASHLFHPRACRARSSSSLTFALSKLYACCSTQLIHLSSIVIRFRAGLSFPHSLHSSNVGSDISLGCLLSRIKYFHFPSCARRPGSSSSISFYSVMVDATCILVLDFAFIGRIHFLPAREHLQPHSHESCRSRTPRSYHSELFLLHYNWCQKSGHTEDIFF
jgi:hypothetical protein